MTQEQARAFILKVLDCAGDISALIPGTIDDTIVVSAKKAVENDLLWGWIWAAISRWVQSEDDPIIVGDAPVEVEGINPLVLIALVKAIYELYKQLRPSA